MTNANPSDMASSRRWSDLGIRAASGVVLVAIAIGTALIGGDVFALAWLALALAVLWEWQRLVGVSALRLRMLVGGAGLVAAAVLMRLGRPEAFAIIPVTAILVATFAGNRRLWTGAGVIYAGLLILAVLALRFSDTSGVRSIIWLFATVWSTDTFAYFGGRLVGGPKLSPRISPSKTWSGTVSGLAAGALIGTFVATHDLAPPVAYLPIFLVTLATSFISQAGDAFESAIKRHFGVKDSSRLIPGHGGIMDRLDGFIAAATFALCVGLVRGGVPSVADKLFHWG